jgi:molecular chaperone GrpE
VINLDPSSGKKKAKKKSKKKLVKSDSNLKRKKKKSKKLQTSPEEDTSSGVDWTYDETEIQLRQKDAQIAEIQARNYMLERDKYNFQSEIAHLRTDQDRKTELLTQYKEELDSIKKEFRNFKKRVREDEDKYRKKANEQLVTGLLDVVDNIDRATSLTKPTEDNKDLLKGVHMINKQLFEILERHGLEYINAKGKKFNPHEHESVERIETKEYPHNTVIEEVQKGYLFNGNVIRPSKVKVSVKLMTLKTKSNKDSGEEKDKPVSKKGKKKKSKKISSKRRSSTETSDDEWIE